MHFQPAALRRLEVTHVPFALCPFCGIASETPHDTQAACIEALRTEISRTQAMLTRSTPLSGTRCPVPDKTPEPETGDR